MVRVKMCLVLIIGVAVGVAALVLCVEICVGKWKNYKANTVNFSFPLFLSLFVSYRLVHRICYRPVKQFCEHACDLCVKAKLWIFKSNFKCFFLRLPFAFLSSIVFSSLVGTALHLPASFIFIQVAWWSPGHG